ncbi:hypothetical protein L4D74_05795 [Vibrio cionasavignyae]
MKQLAEAKNMANPIYDPIHLPCPDMAGCANPDPDKTQRSRFLVQKLREKHGIRKRVQHRCKPLTYRCTPTRCIESWEA